MLRDLLASCRSVRRFRQEPKPSPAQLRDLVSLASLCPSGGNLQPLKFLLSATEETNRRIFPHLRWAGALKDWPGPAPGERPTAYVVILGDTDVSRSFGVDHGIAAQTMMLGAVEMGLGGCMIGSIDRDALRKDLQIPGRFQILLVLALGTPGETVELEPVKDGVTRYWRDAQSVHHVPKRPVDELIYRGTGEE